MNETEKVIKKVNSNKSSTKKKKQKTVESVACDFDDPKIEIYPDERHINRTHKFPDPALGHRNE